MKSVFTMDDAKTLRQTILKSIESRVDIDGKNYVLLSGGIDSAVVAFAFTELGIPFTAINFKFDGMDNKDTESVKKLQAASGINVEYITLESENMALIKDAVIMCHSIFGRIRKVKVETIYALRQTRDKIKSEWNVFSGNCGDARCCYNRSDAIIIGTLGEEHPEVVKFRHGVHDADDKTVADEFEHIFNDRKYFTPYADKKVINCFAQYTSRALNANFPKSCLVYAFSDYFQKYKCARKPAPFQKASNEDIMFEQMAQKYGYKNALAWFNAIDKQIRGKA